MNLKVLLVDDDKMAVFLQEIIILESGFTSDLSTFSNGKDTLEYLDSDHYSGDDYLIFLDINMPVMNGKEFLDQLKTRVYADRVFVAMVSSYSAKADEEFKKYRQVIYTFEKPITAELCDKIKKLPELSKLLSSTS